MGKGSKTKKTKRQNSIKIRQENKGFLSVQPCLSKREGCLYFDFPDGWVVEKYDAWKFVKNDKGGQHLGFNGIKDQDIRSVDFCAIDRDSILWFIEVKDYRKSIKKEESVFFRSICDKFLCSMAGLFAARYTARDGEKEFAEKCSCTISMRFVLHLELPEATNKWEAAIIDVKDIQDKMEQKFSRVAPNPLLVSIKYPQNLPWKVRDVTSSQ